MFFAVNSLNPGVTSVIISWPVKFDRPGECTCSPEKDCLWWHWLTFQPCEWKSSSESSALWIVSSRSYKSLVFVLIVWWNLQCYWSSVSLAIMLLAVWLVSWWLVYWSGDQKLSGQWFKACLYMTSRCWTRNITQNILSLSLPRRTNGNNYKMLGETLWRSNIPST